MNRKRFFQVLGLVGLGIGFFPTRILAKLGKYSGFDPRKAYGSYLYTTSYIPHYRHAEIAFRRNPILREAKRVLISGMEATIPPAYRGRVEWSYSMPGSFGMADPLNQLGMVSWRYQPLRKKV